MASPLSPWQSVRPTKPDAENLCPSGSRRMEPCRGRGAARTARARPHADAHVLAADGGTLQNTPEPVPAAVKRWLGANLGSAPRRLFPTSQPLGGGGWMPMLTGWQQDPSWHQDARCVRRAVLQTARDQGAAGTHRGCSEEQTWPIALMWAVVIKHRASQQAPCHTAPLTPFMDLSNFFPSF